MLWSYSVTGYRLSEYFLFLDPNIICPLLITDELQTRQGSQKLLVRFYNLRTGRTFPKVPSAEYGGPRYNINLHTNTDYPALLLSDSDDSR